MYGCNLLFVPQRTASLANRGRPCTSGDPVLTTALCSEGCAWLTASSFAAARAGQQTLQGVRLAPSAFPNCLGDTHLKPLHLCFDLGRFDWSHICAGGEDAPAPALSCRPPSSAFPRTTIGQDSLAMNDRAEVSPLSRRAMSQPVSRPLRPGIRLLRIPPPNTPTAFLTVRLPLPAA
jgi:hypothetical protein